MWVKDILARRQPTFSLEFFPPKTEEGMGNLFATIAELLPLKPDYVSVTYGAGGSTRAHTHTLAVRIQHDIGLPVVSHLTCVGHSTMEMGSILEQCQQDEIVNILALRGDPPKGQADFVQPADGFNHAADLVAFIKRHFSAVCVGVAGFPEGHPATPNRLLEIDYLKAKVDAGADYIVTQLFFDNRDFFDFCERCELAGIRVPIIAGIMPITTRQGMIRMAELAAGARIPAPLLKEVGQMGDDASIAQIGIRWASEQVRELVDHGARGIHVYTLNSATETKQIFASLGGRDSEP